MGSQNMRTALAHALTKICNHHFRQGLGSSYLPPREAAGQSEQLQPDSLYSSRGLYTEEPRAAGASTGVGGKSLSPLILIYMVLLF